MAKMDYLFAADPPRQPLTSLAAIVADWSWRFGAEGKSKHMRDRVVQYCVEASSIDEAIDRACASRDAKGKMHNHQTRVRKIVRNEYARLLKKWLSRKVYNFHSLWLVCERYRIWGIGPVTSYDVATRIGAYLKLEPQHLYLHGDVSTGYRKMRGLDPNAPLPSFVAVSDLPTVLRSLPADEIEDLLCTYRDYINAEH